MTNNYIANLNISEMAKIDLPAIIDRYPYVSHQEGMVYPMTSNWSICATALGTTVLLPKIMII